MEITYNSHVWQLEKEAKFIEDVAAELALDPSYVEKDLWITKFLEIISQLCYDGVRFIFSGGTCLFKAYSLVNRFSEDIDFRVCGDALAKRSSRKKIIDRLIEDLERLGLNIKDVQKHNNHKMLEFIVYYPGVFKHQSLRPCLKLEFMFEEAKFPTQLKNIYPLHDRLTKDSDGFSIHCIDPIEVAANKVSALIWRVSNRDRSAEIGTDKNDPTIIRHLYDIVAIVDSDRLEESFCKLVGQCYEKDKNRGTVVLEDNLYKQANIVCDLFTNDLLYSKEFVGYVAEVSFADGGDQQINFRQALKKFKQIVAKLK